MTAKADPLTLDVLSDVGVARERIRLTIRGGGGSRVLDAAYGRVRNADDCDLRAALVDLAAHAVAWAEAPLVRRAGLDRRVVVWCLGCGRPHPHRFYLNCPYCLSERRDEREAWMGPPP